MVSLRDALVPMSSKMGRNKLLTETYLKGTFSETNNFRRKATSEFFICNFTFIFENLTFTNIHKFGDSRISSSLKTSVYV